MSAGLIAAIWNDENTEIVILLDSDSNDNTIVMLLIISAGGHFGQYDGFAVPVRVINIYF